MPEYAETPHAYVLALLHMCELVMTQRTVMSVHCLDDEDGWVLHVPRQTRRRQNVAAATKRNASEDRPNDGHFEENHDGSVGSEHHLSNSGNGDSGDGDSSDGDLGDCDSGDGGSSVGDSGDSALDDGDSSDGNATSFREITIAGVCGRSEQATGVLYDLRQATEVDVDAWLVVHGRAFLRYMERDLEDVDMTLERMHTVLTGERSLRPGGFIHQLARDRIDWWSRDVVARFMRCLEMHVVRYTQRYLAELPTLQARLQVCYFQRNNRSIPPGVMDLRFESDTFQRFLAEHDVFDQVRFVLMPNYTRGDWRLCTVRDRNTTNRVRVPLVVEHDGVTVNSARTVAHCVNYETALEVARESLVAVDASNRYPCTIL
jgi:hypothetical protein